MVFSLLRRMNPTDGDLTAASSVWLASRLMPGAGRDGITFPSHLIVADTATRTMGLENPLGGEGLVCFSTGAAGIRYATGSQINAMRWCGCWMVAGTGAHNQSVIGHATTGGVVAPCNRFNPGYRYRNGWRPLHVG